MQTGNHFLLKTLFRLLKTFCHRLRLLNSQTAGNVVVEFALIVPFFIIVFTGLYDLVSFALAQTKLERLGATFADAASRDTTTKATLQGYMSAVNNMALPLDFTGGTVIISHISNTGYTKDPSKMVINWQIKSNSNASSKLGTAGQYPTAMPGDLQLTGYEEAVVAEVVYTFRPLFKVDFMKTYYNIYTAAVYGVRSGTLTSLADS